MKSLWEAHYRSKEKLSRELEECTFYPNGILGKGKIKGIDANEFYQRNIEWQKKKEEEATRKYEELYTVTSYDRV